MAKRAAPKQKLYRCIDCANCKPDFSSLSIKKKLPILGNCEFEKFSFLLNSYYCETHFQPTNKY